MDSANIACSRSASLPARLSPSPLPPPPLCPPSSSAADGNGLDDRGNKEETRWGGGGDGDGEIWEGKQGRRRKWKDEKCWEVERSAGGGLACGE